jgi:hypothetical protein
LLLISATVVRVWTSPQRASNLDVVPDSEEYAIGAQRLATLGRYDIEIDRVAYPPRYAPWFPAMLAPVFLVAPREIGAAILPVLAFALAAVWAAYRIGRRLAGAGGGPDGGVLAGLLGGAAAGALLGSNVVFGLWARQIMSDVPATALALWALDRYLARAETGRGSAWVPAILVAFATALRVESAALWLPFALQTGREPAHGVRRLMILTLPLLALVVATAVYQHATFGDVRRNGYMFWAPLPCDYPKLTYSLDYIGRNLVSLRTPGFFVAAAFGAVGASVLLAQGSVLARRALVFAALVALPETAFHLVFSFASPRFHLNLIAFLSVIGAAGVASTIPADWVRRVRFAPAAIAPAVIALVPALLPGLRPRVSIRTTTAEALARETPDDAVVVSGIDPVFLEFHLLPGTRRRVVPANRGIEYASKAVAWKRIPLPDPVPKWSEQEGIAWLVEHGAVRVCPFTADERPDQIAAWVRQGTPVFLDRSFLRPKDYPAAPFEKLGLALVPLDGLPWLERFVAQE